MHPFFVLAVIEHYIEAPRHGNNELMQSLMGVSSTLRTPWHVIKIVDALNVKWYVMTALYKSEIPARILNLGKINNFAVIDIHAVHASLIFR